MVIKKLKQSSGKLKEKSIRCDGCLRMRSEEAMGLGMVFEILDKQLKEYPELTKQKYQLCFVCLMRHYGVKINILYEEKKRGCKK